MELPWPTALSVRRTMAMAQSMNMTAHQVVALESTLAAPRGPKAVWLPAPPKAPARSAALPLWSSTTMIRTRQFKMKKLVSSQAANRKPSATTPTPISSAITHWNAVFVSIPSSIKKSEIPSCTGALLEIHERGERLGVKARSANKRAVQFFLRHQPENIVRLDAAAIDNPAAGGLAPGEILPRPAPQ